MDVLCSSATSPATALPAVTASLPRLFLCILGGKEQSCLQLLKNTQTPGDGGHHPTCITVPGQHVEFPRRTKRNFFVRSAFVKQRSAGTADLLGAARLASRYLLLRYYIIFNCTILKQQLAQPPTRGF